MRLSPGREGTWFSIVCDTPAPTSPPSQGGTRGVFPILPTAPMPPQDPPCPSLRGRGPGFCRSATRQPSRLPPHRGEQGGSFLFCPLRPCHRKTLPVPPFEGGDLVSVGQQHDSPRVSPLIGGNKGGLSILAAAPCLLPLACCPVSESQSRNPLHLTPQTSSSSANHNASLTSIGKHSASRSYPDVLLVK